MADEQGSRWRLCCVRGWPWDLRDKGRQHWEREATQIRQKQGKRTSRGQLGLALADDVPWLKAKQNDGRVQSWVLSNSTSHHSELVETDLHTSIASLEPWRLSFAWEFISQSEGLGLRVLCARPPSSPTSSLHRSVASETEETRDGDSPTEEREDRFGMHTPVILEEFWAVEAPDTATAAAVFSAVANILTPELLGPHPGLQRAEVLDSQAEGILQDENDHDSRLLRAKLCKERDELRATHVLLATSEQSLSLRPLPRALRESMEDSITNSSLPAIELPLNPMAFDGMAFVPFLRSRPEVRLLTAVLRVAVEAALHLCEGNLVLSGRLKRFGFDDRSCLKLKRLILPWMCGTSVPDDVLDGLVWGFTFGWPEAPSSLMSTQPSMLL